MSDAQQQKPAGEWVPSAEHGKMPKWLFFIWVAFLAWGIVYLFLYALPDLKEWSNKPLPTAYERPR